MASAVPADNEPAHPAPLERGHGRVCSRIRKCVEAVDPQLTERFAVERIRVHAPWHFQHRLIRKVLAHTAGVSLNLPLGRPPLDSDGLLEA